jgi:8-oxo-dGTP pyrophosphatase MutT (NUDIX family)
MGLLAKWGRQDVNLRAKLRRMTIRGAGILFKTQDGQALFLQRGPDGDHANEWCIPGGKLEEGEASEAAAFREAREEAGRRVPKGARTLLARTIAPPGEETEEAVDFTTFLQAVDEPFDVEIDNESVGYAWAPLDNPPLPLHPGVVIALERLTADELGVARMMAAGTLTSPQHYENVALFDIRITGTGVAYREAHNEFVHRSPDNYLNPEFLARCNGLPVIWEHPEKSLLTSKEFGDRVVGSVFLPYIKGDEVWAVVKVWDSSAIKALENGQLSTSPAVNFKDATVNSKLALEDGSVLLIEGKPSLLDHLAFCERGVWDKGGAPSGVNSTRADGTTMTDDDKKAAADAAVKAKADADAADKSRKDAEDNRWAKLDAFMDSTTKRMDAIEASKKDAAKKDAASKKDGEEETKKSNEAANEPGAGDDKEVERKAGEPMFKKGERDDAAKKDSKAKADEDDDETEEEKKAREKREREARDDAAKAKADAAAAVAENADLKRRLAAIEQNMPKALSDADYAAMSTVQAKADSVFQAFSQKAPRPLEGETVLAYRRRLATTLKDHSHTWKGVDLTAFADANAFGVAEQQIYADAMTAARNPVGLPDGELREIVSTDETGRRIVSFHGQPRSWMASFSAPRGRLVNISTKSA